MKISGERKKSQWTAPWTAPKSGDSSGLWVSGARDARAQARRRARTSALAASLGRARGRRGSCWRLARSARCGGSALCRGSAPQRRAARGRPRAGGRRALRCGAAGGEARRNERNRANPASRDHAGAGESHPPAFAGLGHTVRSTHSGLQAPRRAAPRRAEPRPWP